MNNTITTDITVEQKIISGDITQTPNIISVPVTLGYKGDKGDQGDSFQQTWETISKNLLSYPAIFNRAGNGELSSIVYNVGGGQFITKL